MFSIEQSDGPVTILRMDDGAVNAIGPSFVTEFPQALGEAAEPPGAVVLTGNAKAFSAGLDLKTLPGLAPDELAGFFRGFNTSIRALLACRRPVVAAIQGPAIAGGAVLALACDIRVGDPSAVIGLTEVRVAVPFPPPVLALARARLPADEHGPALLEGSLRAAPACGERGWVHELTEPGHARDRATERAEGMATSDAATFQDAKRALNGELLDAIDHFDKNVDPFLEHFQREGAMEAIQEGFRRARGG